MISRLSNLPGPAKGAGLVVLVFTLSLAGSSVAEPVRDAAKRLITGKQIKDRSLGVRDLSPKARRALRGNRGPRGLTGPQGPGGAAGAPGTSVFSGSIPSGMTVRGGVSLRGTPPLESTVNLPAPAPVALDAAHVQFTDSAGNIALDEDVTCTGETTNPTAPPGKVCLYAIDANGGQASGESVGASLASRYAFRVMCGTCDTLRAAWAYTAP